MNNECYVVIEHAPKSLQTQLDAGQDILISFQSKADYPRTAYEQEEKDSCIYRVAQKKQAVDTVHQLTFFEPPCTARSVASELIPFSGALSRRVLNQLAKLANDHRSARWPTQLTASAFNRLGQYASSPGNRAYCYAELPFLPRCMECRRGLAMRILSVCLPVRVSFKCVDYDKTEERSVQIFIPYKRLFDLEKWLVGGDIFN